MNENEKDVEERYRICWNITSNCNENCKYCHRFMENEKDFEENMTILKKMIEDGVTNITWSGGEALLYQNVVELMKYAKQNGVKNKLITNGIVFSQLDIEKKEE